MIKAIMLDVDGVILGNNIGINSPLPHPDVIKRLKEIQDRGMSISLNTGRPAFAVEQIIKIADLDNLHSAGAGTVIFNPLASQGHSQVKSTHNLPVDLVHEIIEKFIDLPIYFEAAFADGYAIINKINDAALKHAKDFLGRDPMPTPNWRETDLETRINHLFLSSDNIDQTEFIREQLNPFTDRISLHYTTNPIQPNHLSVLIMPAGINKRTGAIEISEYNQLDLNNYLGVGDSTDDWQFLSQCGYVTAMGNASNELKKLVKQKGRDENGKLRYFIAPDVNDNGLLAALDYFNL